MCWSQEPVIKKFANIEFEEIVITDDDGLHSWENMEIFHEDEEGIIWTAINQGLFRYNGHTVINVSNYLFRVHGIDLSRQPGIRILTDKNIIWYGTRKGLYKIDKKELKATKVFLDEPLYTRDYRNYINKLQRVGDTLYVGTANGLYLLNKNTNKILKTYFTNGKDLNRRHSSNVVQSLYPDIENGFIWVALDSGMYRVNKQDDSIDRYTMRGIGPNAHHLYDGELYDDVLLMPSWGSGMVTFNIKTKEFYRIDSLSNTGGRFDYTVILGAIKLNDSLSLVNVNGKGNGLFNRHTNTFQWIKTPEPMKNGSVLDLDRSGYVWGSFKGRIFRSTKPVVYHPQVFEHIIDVTAFKANEVLKSRPAIDGYSLLTLDEKESNIDIEFTISKPYILDTIRYEYRLDSKNWKPIKTANNLKIFGLNPGTHELKIRALNKDETILTGRDLAFNVYQPFYKSPYFIGLGLIILLTSIYLFGRYRNTQKMKTQKMQYNYEMQLSKLESEALRSQINPHFIFNTLNGIKYYAIKKTKEETTDFITKFSILIRQVLENSKQSLISLEEELKTIQSYIEIEKYRFSGSFDFSIEIDPSVDLNFLIPPMIVQPFIENAIWHGLMHKDVSRNLYIRCKQKEHVIAFEIEDNGIGRKAANEISKSKLHKSSLGIKITKDRLKQLKMLYSLECDLEIIDLYSRDNKASGTKVIIQFKK